MTQIHVFFLDDQPSSHKPLYCYYESYEWFILLQSWNVAEHIYLYWIYSR